MSSNVRTVVLLLVGGFAIAAAAIFFLAPDENAMDTGGKHHVVAVDDSNFEKEVLDSKIPVVIDFWAPGCDPCKQYSPIFHQVSNDYVGKVKFVTINAANAPKVTNMLGIGAVPTTMVVRPEADGSYSLGGIPGALTDVILKQIIDFAVDPANELVNVQFEKDADGNLSIKLPAPDNPKPTEEDPAKK